MMRNLSANRVRAAVRLGLQFLAADQQPDGSWLGLISQTPDFSSPVPVSECFTTAFILRALAGFAARDPAVSSRKDFRSQPCIQKALDFLLRSRSPDGLWRFYGPGSARLPADFDTTACAATALETCAIRVSPDPIRAALSAHLHPQGGYWTWVMPAEAPSNHWPYQIRRNERDWTVNACILWWLHQTGQQDEPLLDELIHVLRKGRYVKPTPYYDSPYLFLFTLYGALKAAKEKYARLTGEVERVVLDFINRPEQSYLEEALGLLCLPAAEGHPPGYRSAVEHLVSGQSRDGSWPVQTIFGVQRQAYYGCRAASTALAVAGLWNSIERDYA